MSIKKDTLGNISAKSLEDTFRCSECLHFKKHAHPSMQEICSKRGIRPFAIAPKCFTPDVTQIANNSDTFVQLAALFSDYTVKQRRILVALFRQKYTKRNIPFGTKVYFHGMGRDYISNYLSGYVMGVTSSGDLIITGSPDKNTRGRSYMAYMQDSDLLMTAKEWKIKREELKAAGKIIDPNSRIVPKGTAFEDVVTIDSAPAAWHDKQEATSKKSKKDLTFKVS
jgi:hypothetical protein